MRKGTAEERKRFSLPLSAFAACGARRRQALPQRKTELHWLPLTQRIGLRGDTIGVLNSSIAFLPVRTRICSLTMEGKHSPFEAKEISQAAKGLKEAKTDDHSSLKASLEYDSKLANSVAKIYEEKEGDLRYSSPFVIAFPASYHEFTH